MTNTIVDWRYSGRPDGFFGAGATSAERILALTAAIVLTGAIVLALRMGEYEAASGWRLWLLIFFAFDVAGGVTANMLNSCKRFYHAPLQPNEHGFIAFIKGSFNFALLHIHPMVVAAAFGGALVDGVIWYGLLLAGTALTLATPLYLRRSMAASIVVFAAIASLYWLPLAPGMEWFIPCLFIKIVLGHAVQEEPYRPNSVKRSALSAAQTAK